MPHFPGEKLGTTSLQIFPFVVCLIRVCVEWVGTKMCHVFFLDAESHMGAVGGNDAIWHLTALHSRQVKPREFY